MFDLVCGDWTLHLSDRSHIMGILNVTPDSFYDGGRYLDPEKAVQKAIGIAGEGADILDIGGESTRPGAEPVSVKEELSRVIPVIQKLQKRIGIPISIDTRKAVVAEAAIQAGAQLINDVGGLKDDPDMAKIAAKYQVPVVIMHKKGSPKDMQVSPKYHDVIQEIHDFMDASIRSAEDEGISKKKIILDPGIGFGKTAEDNYSILRKLSFLQDLGCPVLVGVSRKSFIGNVLNVKEEKRLLGTAAAVAISVFLGAHIVRVHDVREMVEVVRIADRMKNCGR